MSTIGFIQIQLNGPVWFLEFMRVNPLLILLLSFYLADTFWFVKQLAVWNIWVLKELAPL